MPPSSAPVGVNPSCGIPRLGQDGSLSNIANIAVCGLSLFLVSYLVFHCYRRKAAVGMLTFLSLLFFSLLSLLLITSLGRIELVIFLILYFLTLAFQLVTTGSFLEQGSSPLVIVTAIHAGLVITLFWSLLANAIVATQIIEDGSMSSLIVCFQVTMLILQF